MKDLILFLAKSLVENPDAVQVTETEGPDSIILELNVAPEDMGKVIGKQGAHRQGDSFGAQGRYAQGQQACFS